MKKLQLGLIVIAILLIAGLTVALLRARSETRRLSYPIAQYYALCMLQESTLRSAAFNLGSPNAPRSYQFALENFLNEFSTSNSLWITHDEVMLCVDKDKTHPADPTTQLYRSRCGESPTAECLRAMALTAADAIRAHLRSIYDEPPRGIYDELPPRE